MSSLKRSETRKAKYGTRNHHDLLFALKLLLQLKGTEFQTKTPDFDPPSAEEFLGYCQSVNTNFSKTRARFITKRRAVRVKRPLLAGSTGRTISERLTAFSLFIVRDSLSADTPFEHFLVCATIVMEACINYLFVIEYLNHVAHGAKNPAIATIDSMNTTLFHNGIQKLMKCYFDVYCSSIVVVKQPTIDILYNYLNLYLMPLYKIPELPTTNIVDLSKVSISAFGTLYTDAKFLRKQVQDPLEHICKKEGFVLP